MGSIAKRSSPAEVLVIGGGATGAGIARDLAMRGVGVILAEAGDFSSGASGANHGMLHSGARYAVRDPESAKECAAENKVLKRISPFCIEDTGGLFASMPEDDQDYEGRFLACCRSTGVEVKEIAVSEALKLEPGLSPELRRAVEVNDGSIDPFFLVWGNVESARDAGGEALNHSPVTSMKVKDGRIESVVLGKGGRRRTFRPEIVVNAAGAWATWVAAMAGADLPVKVDKGTMVVLNGRLVDRLVNRLRPPSDGDILVPHRSATLLGTTSGPGSLDHIRATEEEVEKLMAQGNRVMPGMYSARAVRAYAGVRPLLAGGGDGREASRTFRVVDHTGDGVDNLISVVGGKLTTYRLMAEKASDAVMERLGRSTACRTAIEEIMSPGDACARSFRERNILNKYGAAYGEIMASCASPGGSEEACSCEGVSQGELEYFAASPDVMSPGDLMRRTRAGMGFCQSGLCAFRLASALGSEDPISDVRQFLGERWKGVEPVLCGEQLRQEAFKAHLFKVYGIDHTKEAKG